MPALRPGLPPAWCGQDCTPSGPQREAALMARTKPPCLTPAPDRLTLELMRSGSAAKSLFVWFAALVLLYLVCFYGIEFWRRQNGPWLMQFLSDPDAQPVVEISHRQLQPTAVRLVFLGERTAPDPLPRRMILDTPLQSLPFGRRLHEDLTSLPGVETIDFFGHVVELSPRVLRVNHQPFPWGPPKTLHLTATNKPGAPLPPSRALAR